jgi:hypothetical protein
MIPSGLLSEQKKVRQEARNGELRTYLVWEWRGERGVIVEDSTVIHAQPEKKKVEARLQQEGRERMGLGRRCLRQIKKLKSSIVRA